MNLFGLAFEAVLQTKVGAFRYMRGRQRKGRGREVGTMFSGLLDMIRFPATGHIVKAGELAANIVEAAAAKGNSHGHPVRSPARTAPRSCRQQRDRQTFIDPGLIRTERTTSLEEGGDALERRTPSSPGSLVAGKSRRAGNPAALVHRRSLGGRGLIAGANE
jgi:hypothetical protein